MIKKIFQSKAISSFFWVAFEKFGYSGINFISTIILARLLSPSDYGLIGVLAIFISFSQMIVESGLGGALVKKENVTDQDYDTIFTFNIICSTILYIALYFSASLISDFYKNDNLIIITRIVGLNLFFSALTLTQKVHLIRKLMFKRQSFISIVSLLLGVLISIPIALSGYGVWALIAQQLAYNIFYFVIIFCMVKYKPKLKFNKNSFSELYGFGSKVFGASLLNILFNDGLSSYIAKKYTITTTGFYYQAKKLVDFPINIFRAFGDNIVFPLLSRENDAYKFASTASLLMKMILLISLPIFVILYFYSTEIVSIVLGKQWIQSSMMLNILSLSSIGFIIDTVSRNILKATGNGGVILKSEFIKKIIAFLIILSVVDFNLNILLYSIVIGNILGCLINLYYVNNTTKYKFKEQIFDILPIVAVGIISGLLVKYSLECLSINSNLKLLIEITLILIIYFTVNLIFFIKPKELLILNTK